VKYMILDGHGDLDFASPEDVDAYHDLALQKILWMCRQDGHLTARGAAPHNWSSSLDVRQRFRALPLQNGTCRVDFADASIDEILAKSNAAGSTVVYATSGSTGSPKVLLDSYAEVLHNSLFHGKGYRACGIRPSDRVITLGEVGRFAGEYAVIHALSATGCMIIPFVDRTRIQENIAQMYGIRANVWLAMQTEMFPYLAAFEKVPQKVPPLRLVVTGGEAISTETSRRLRDIFGDDLRIRSTFQTSDAGTLGYQCAWCEPDEYHIHEELQFVEILDGHGRETSGPGRLVLTNLVRSFLPTVRFQTGDEAQWTPGDSVCPCRRTARKIRLFGRGGRIIRLGSAEIEISALESIRNIASDAGMQCQIILSHDSSGRTDVSIHSHEPLPEDVQRRILRACERLDAYLDARRDGSVREPIFRTGFADDANYRGFSKFIPVVETFQ
jgi:phenylacetate-coenzyme A ligase PaaK-like adenylate-forming protein